MDTKIGLEVHFQLNTGKLFCRCPVEQTQDEMFRFRRKLHISASELGNIDAAASYESMRSRSFEYIVADNSCLVEMDEEPPKSPNRLALATAIAVSRSLGCDVMDHITYMRKIVIDGSNTTGFQRTAIVGINGRIETSRGPVRISTVCLEEDAARKIEEKNNVVVYSLDRLGIPLIEISTEPDIVDEEHAVEVARSIGYLVISTGNARRAVDAVRQDVNFSMGYGRVEIKGVSKLAQIRDVIRYERERQENLRIAVDTIRSRGGIDRSSFKLKDVSDFFSNTKSKIIRNGLESGRIFASLLKNMAGTLKNGKLRMGKEIADLVRSYGIKGVMHSDELPGYGLTAEEVETVYRSLGKSENDAVLLIVMDPARVSFIENAIFDRIQKIMSMDLSETRGPSGDETVFLRPMPGKDRMYPETDVPVIEVGADLAAMASSIRPRTYGEVVQDLVKTYGISKQNAEYIASEMILDLFQRMAQLIDAREAARMITQIIPDLERKTGKVLDQDKILRLCQRSKEMQLDRYQLEKALEILYEKNSVEAALSDSRIRELSRQELEDLISDILNTRGDATRNAIIALIRERTDRVFDPRMAMECFNEVKNRR
ncbi:Glu-tRNA(Gln) amidotransferase subunit GatE [Thermoplasma sp.]|uniref:Glu-tRNA(Gln) amidotransferase subunit GatE n=1 Tax=Thermoplasma sp. TaxID=1973142 RepID=UPI001280615F|nr:Glu-tRNA(Gln) amidotransferase subunit GatE [Thermoplasma sp.]KAA8923205.1 MAG: Glu-tRNA(Gln) amidotransferase subunit GatE [Thermoplasma sp.]